MIKLLSSLALTGALLLVGCTSTSSAPSDSTASQTSPAGDDANPADTVGETADADSPNSTVPAPKPAVGKVDVQPGQSTDGFEGALADVTTETCELDGSKWKISGTVKNTSDSDAAYRIYVALNKKDTTDTLALVQVNANVAKGDSDKWSTEAEVSEKDLICVLRVERTAEK